jgi:hypothetical protein
MFNGEPQRKVDPAKADADLEKIADATKADAERLERERIAAAAKADAERLKRERIAATKAKAEAERLELERVRNLVNCSKGLTLIFQVLNILYSKVHELTINSQYNKIITRPEIKAIKVNILIEILFSINFFKCDSVSFDFMSTKEELKEMDADTDTDIETITDEPDCDIIESYNLICMGILNMNFSHKDHIIHMMILIHQPKFINFLERKILEKIGDDKFKIDEFVSLWTYIIKPHRYSFFYLMLIKVLLKFKKYDMCEKIAKIMAEKCCHEQPEIIEYIRSCIHKNLKDNGDYDEKEETINSKFRLIRFPNYYVELDLGTGLDPDTNYEELYPRY